MEVLCLFFPRQPPPEALHQAAGEAGPGDAARPFDAALEALDRFSPAVEASPPEKAFLDITGTRKMFGPAADLAEQAVREVQRAAGRRPRAAVASSKFVAGAAAPLAAAGPLVVPAGEEMRFLAPLPVELLPISPEALSRLRRLGLRRLGQVAALPENALASQLGAEGAAAHRLASGMDREPVVPRPRPDILEETLSFETPLESLEPLLAALDKMLDRLVPRLRKRYQACGQLRLRFISDAAAPGAAGRDAVGPDGARFHGARSDAVRPRPDAVDLKAPLESKTEILGVLKRHLEAAAFPGGVSEVRLALARLGGEAGRQAPLSSATRRRQEEALRRLEKDLGDRFGRSSLKKVVALDPGSRIPERRMALVDAAGEEQGCAGGDSPGRET